MLSKMIVILLAMIFSQINCATIGLKPLTPSEDYTHSAIVDEDNPSQFVLFWKRLGTDEIQFEAHCRTTGWVGFGLSPNGGMAGADISIGWVQDSNGKGYLKDTHATGFSTPQTDPKQDWQLIEAAQLNDYTIIKMKRKLDTCDESHDIVIREETNYLIFAWNDKDPITGNNDWGYHGTNNRRTKVDYLLLYKNETLSEEDVDIEDAYIAEYTLDRLPVKKQRTFYYCQIVEIPQYDTDVHLIRYDVQIEKANRDIVHHIVMYQCPPTLNVDGLPLGTECGWAPVDKHFSQCISGPITMAWGVGGNRVLFGNYSFPRNTGLPIYKSSTKRYVLMEFHYDNPKLDENRVDSSGVRFYFTPRLREHEIGILTVGTDTIFIDITLPPQIEGLKFTSTCHEECTSKFFPADGITVFSGFLHTHLAGQSVRTRLVRNNRVVKHLFDNPKYDFNYQFNIEIEPIQLKRGDVLVTDCTYQTKDRDHPTFWGYSTMEEMCFNFVYYYPKMRNFDKCFSKPTNKALFDFYRGLQADGLVPPMVLNEDYYWLSINTIKNTLETRTNFTDELRDRFIEFYNDVGKERVICGSTFAQDELIYNIEKNTTIPIDDSVKPNNCLPANGSVKNQQGFLFFMPLILLLLKVF